MENTEIKLDKLHCFVDLHYHLDGSLPPECVRTLARMQHIALPDSDDALLRMLQVGEDCRSLEDFLDKFVLADALLQTPEALETAARAEVQAMRKIGVMYAEIRFAPQLHTRKGMTQRDAIDAVLRGARDGGIPVQLILCCMRAADNERENNETLEIAHEYLGKGVAALDLAGTEAPYPIAVHYRALFERAAAWHVPFTVHAGEGADAENVRAAIELGASRIGHGVRVLESAAATQFLAQKGVPLECCPTSNVMTRIFASVTDFPLHELQHARLIVTINSDDMTVCHTDIRNEYRRLIDHQHLTRNEVRSLLENGVRASFAPDELKARMMTQIAADFAVM